jgi:hypothetical protein
VTAGETKTRVFPTHIDRFPGEMKHVHTKAWRHASLLCGSDLPKQFVSFDGRRTLLQQTAEPIRPLADWHHNVVVASENRALLAGQQLAA